MCVFFNDMFMIFDVSRYVSSLSKDRCFVNVYQVLQVLQVLLGPPVSGTAAERNLDLFAPGIPSVPENSGQVLGWTHKTAGHGLLIVVNTYQT